MHPDHPVAPDRERLLDQLGQVLARMGARRFCSGDVLQPTHAYFPDAYRTGPAGVQAVAHRMLWWAGVRSLQVAVVDVTSERPNQRSWSIDLAEVRDDLATLVLEGEGEAPDLPGALAAVLAEAVREQRGRVGVDPAKASLPYRERRPQADETEGQLATIATFALGWGVLATEAAQRIQTGPDTVGDWLNYRVLTTEHGGLGFAHMAFLLAVQAVIRDPQPSAKVWAKHLRPNQSALFQQWVRALIPKRDALQAQLAIAASETQPAAARPRLAPHPFSREEMDQWPPLPETKSPGPVFRVPGGLLLRGWVALAALVRRRPRSGNIRRSGDARSPRHRFVSPLGEAWTCSNCERLLSTDAPRCTHCGGIVAGEIARREDRLAAEDALPESWWREQGLAPPSNEWADIVEHAAGASINDPDLDAAAAATQKRQPRRDS